MKKLNLKNKWIVVTGASSGLGREIARELAYREGANLVIAARRKERLEELKKEIEGACDSMVHILPVDVATEEGADALFRQATEKAPIYGIVNNAGLTYYGKAEASNLEFFHRIIAVNFSSVMRLTLKFLDYFKQKGSGAILNVTSEASLIPIPYQAVYSASKHGIQAFTEALFMENRGSGVVISSFAPGGINTEMLTNSGLDKKHGVNPLIHMDAAKAARLAIKTLKKGKFINVPGIINKLTVLMVRLFPRRLVARITEMTYTPPE